MANKEDLLNEFTPSGGMNTDDSICAPTLGLEGGVSLFQNGDYRYALNMRIGSSRDDSFGDGQPIKSTRKVQKYYRQTSLFTNSHFTSSLSPWQTIHGPGIGDWIWFDNHAISGVVSGDIIYQPISAVGDVRIRYSYTMPAGTVTNFVLEAVFLSGTTEIGSVVLTTELTPDSYVTKEITVTLPPGCDGLGFRVSAVIVLYGIFSFDFIESYSMEESTIPSGTNKTIGTLVDYEFLRVYESVYNSNNNHVLRYYDLRTDSIYEMVRWSGFNWASNTFVSMAKLDNWLALAERGNNPRLVDTEEITETFLELGSEFREFHIAFAKWAPVDSPSVQFHYDGSTDNSEKFKGKAIQFSYRYIYKGNLRSSWSDGSPVCSVVYDDDGKTVRPMTGINVKMVGMFIDQIGAAVQYNYFNHDDIKCLMAIDKIEIAYRDSQYGVWKMWKTITPTTTAQLFTMEAANTPIATQDIVPPYDTVPIKAGCVTAIDNRFIFSDVLEELSPSATPVIEDVGVSVEDNSDDSWLSQDGASFSALTGPQQTMLSERNSISIRTFKSRGLYNLGIEFKAKDGRKSLAYTADNWIYEIPKINPGSADDIFALQFKFASEYVPPIDAVSYRIVRTNCTNINAFLMGRCNWITPLIDDPTTLVNNVPKTDNDLASALRDQLFNMALVTGKDYDDALAVLENNPVYNPVAKFLRRTSTALAYNSASRLFIDIRNWWSAARSLADGSTNYPLNNLYYNYRPGDRVRFLGSEDPSPTLPVDVKVYDVKILEFTGDALIVEKPKGLQWAVDDSVAVGGGYYIVEVYTPSQDKPENYLLHDVGEWYPVLYPGTDQRAWSKSDWTYSSNATVTATVYGDFTVFNRMPFFLGDCAYIWKSIYHDIIGASVPVYTTEVTSMNPDQDNTYGRWERGGFRPTLGYNTLPVSKFKPTMSRFTGKIVEESSINNLNRMREEDNFIYPSEYGRIRNMTSISNPQLESAGAILLMIGERETWSVYVNRTTLQDLSGRSQVALSDKLLGSFNVLNGSHGTFNPESLTVDKTRAWYWDAIHGSWIRYGRDGLTAVSDNKMRNWFKEIGDLLFTKYDDDSRPKVVSGYDAFNEELLTVIDHPDLPATFRTYDHYKGSMFSEVDKRWKSCHTYNPDMFAHIGNKLLIMQGGEVFVHEEGESYRTFFDVVQPVRIEPVFNIGMQTMKNWHNLFLVSTHKWYGERLQSEFRGSKTIQMTNVQLQLFEDLEDVYAAGILNDVNSGAGNVIDGDKMRSKAIQILLRLDDEVVTRSLLHYVIAGYTMSAKKMIN
jgi:hypothetical protein